MSKLQLVMCTGIAEEKKSQTREVGKTMEIRGFFYLNGAAVSKASTRLPSKQN